uniref:NADH-ubiquinone oxidoreductase chain 4 n=1 Tax=Platorchestia japonica TaxID=462861 RepID=A0A343S9Z6_9CRUS|nr:NADH dehydrogenase subunit 4 [Platorchestia japonica]
MLKCLLGGIFLISCGWGESSVVLSSLILMFFFSNPIYMSISLHFLELDWVSWNLVLLSGWVILLAIFSSMKICFFNKLNKLYLCVMIFLFLFLVLTFLVSDFMLFYMMFEACLIPILLMILGWGYQPERSQAGIYMFFYTLFGSLPLFFIIVYMNKFFGSSYMYFDLDFIFNSGLVFFFMVTGFLIKFPMYGVHLWLLKAHVEAPVAGSMILAGILLKLGGYGLIRFSFFFFDKSLSIFKDFILMFSLWGGLFLSLICLRFMDMKLLIAASSVVHMSSCICGIFILSEWGIKGCLLMMVAHGLCSSGLFCLANIVYERTNSRSMNLNKGLLNILPVFSMWWFFLIVCNMAGPPSLNLVSEIMLLVSIISWNKLSIIVLFFLGFFSAAYSLYLYSLSQHGVFVKNKSKFMSGFVFEYLVLFLHWAPLNILILSTALALYLM